ncbi:MAG: hypothetical protein K9H84_08090 [Bacteroidales bacterium]|nr:hypothetical protein [Bacteroidales bacterium]
MNRIIFTFLFITILIGCDRDKQKAGTYQMKVHKINNHVLNKEAKLQNQIARVMEMQMNDSGVLVNDTNDLYLQTEIKAMHNQHDELLSSIDIAKDSISSMRQLNKYPVLKNASIDFLNDYDKIARNEYSMLIQLISLHDTAYTKEKNKAYIITRKQLNAGLNKAINKFNSRLDEFESKQYKEK